jgi:hypothetical protein
MNYAKLGRQGDVVRVPQLGHIAPKEGHDLVALFLGACRLADEPDVPTYLKQLGFQRTHCFEVTLSWPYSVSRHVFTADSPLEAVEAAVRFALMLETDREEELQGLSLCLTRLGPIGADGKPYNGRGQSFARWSIASSTPVTILLEHARTG